MKIQYENLTIRQADVADAKQLTAWWNDGAVMVHAGFLNGLDTIEEEVIEGLSNGRMVIEESERLIGWLFTNGYSKIVLDTNLTKTRAQHVYESLGFRKVRTNINSWEDQLGQLQSSVDYELVETDFNSYM